MNKDAVKMLARRIMQEDPECQIEGMLNFGGGDYGLEVKDTSIDQTFTILNEKDWFVRLAKKQKGMGDYSKARKRKP